MNQEVVVLSKNAFKVLSDYIADVEECTPVYIPDQDLIDNPTDDICRAIEMENILFVEGEE